MPQNGIALVMCPDLDWWHRATDSNPFIGYIIWNGKILDEPDHMTVLRILNHYPKRERVIVYHICIHCRRRIKVTKGLA